MYTSVEKAKVKRQYALGFKSPYACVTRSFKLKARQRPLSQWASACSVADRAFDASKALGRYTQSAMTGRDQIARA